MKIKQIRTLLACMLIAATLAATGFGQASFSGKRVKRIVVRNAMVVDGSGKPAAGPLDITIENDAKTRTAGSPAPRPPPAATLRA